MRSSFVKLAFLLVGTGVVGTITVLGCGSSSTADILGEVDGGDSGATTGTDGGADAADGNTTTPTDGGDGGTKPGETTDGGVTSEAGPGGDAASVACGAISCAVPGQTCCVSNPDGPGFAFACFGGTTCPTSDAGGGGDGRPVALHCTATANCTGGQVCCISQLDHVVTSECKATCNGVGDQAQLCDKNATPTGCPDGSTCTSKDINEWGLPSGFATCGGN